jgi:enoyl-CoA hydratase
MPDAISYEIDEQRHIAHIELDRPASMNALSRQLIDEYLAALEQAESDNQVRVIVVSGSGDEAFAAGFDMEPESNDEEDSSDAVPSVKDHLDVFEWATEPVYATWDCSKPVIAAVQGYCLSGGSDLAMACDIVIAAEDAEFGYPGVRQGGVPPALTYPFVMNLHEAKEMLFSGKMVDSERAQELGMVNRVVPTDELMSEVHDEVAEIRKVPGQGVRILKQVLNGIAEEQGARPGMKYSHLFDALAHRTEYGKEFYNRGAEGGMEAALEFMNERDKMMSPDHEE